MRTDEIWRATDIEIDSTRSWAGVSAAVFSRDGVETIWRNPSHRLLLLLEGGPKTTYEFDGCGRRAVGPYSPGDVVLYPAARNAHVLHARGRVRCIHVLQDPTVYSSVAMEMAGRSEIDIEPILPVGDALVAQLIRSIAQEAAGGPANRLMVDGLNTALAVQIARRFVRWAPPESFARGLSRDRLRRVLDYVEAHLGAELTLAELAAVACLSPYHFSRCFKRALGVGPHRYLTRRRIERAKEMVVRSEQSLAAIAQAVGFADQSHLTAAFRRETGTTPGRFRAASR